MRSRAGGPPCTSLFRAQLLGEHAFANRPAVSRTFRGLPSESLRIKCFEFCLLTKRESFGKGFQFWSIITTIALNCIQSSASETAISKLFGLFRPLKPYDCPTDFWERHTFHKHFLSLELRYYKQKFIDNSKQR